MKCSYSCNEIPNGPLEAYGDISGIGVSMAQLEARLDTSSLIQLPGGSRFPHYGLVINNIATHLLPHSIQPPSGPFQRP